MSDIHETQVFKKQDLETERIQNILKTVYSALEEKGYNPIDQIIGYILSGDPTYITGFNNARSIIQEIERDELLSELLKSYLRKKMWEILTSIKIQEIIMERILGLDVGDVYIGVALSDPFGMIAQSLTTIKRISKDQTYGEIKELIDKYDVKKVVAGLPKNMNNTLGPQSEKVMKFAEKLKNKYKIELIYVDERMTTLSAEKVLIEGSVRRENRKKYIDRIAATYILQTYLDTQRRNNG